MSPNKDETAVHRCHCSRDMALRMRNLLATPRGACSACLVLRLEGPVGHRLTAIRNFRRSRMFKVTG